MNKKFIVTHDKETKALLQKEGFVLVSEMGNEATFINNNKLTFSGNKNNIAFTNSMSL